MNPLRPSGEPSEVDASGRRPAEPGNLDRVYATTPVALCLLDTDYRFLRVNERCAAMHGIPVEQHVGLTVRDVFPPRLVAQVETVMGRVIETGREVIDLEAEGCNPRRPSERMVCLVSCLPLPGPDGSVETISVSVQDITARKLAEEALEESELRLATIIGSAMDSIIAVDEQLIVRVFNPAAEDVFRCRASEATGSSFERFTTRSFRGALSRCMWAFERNGADRLQAWVPEGMLALRADGEEFPVEATISRGTVGRQKLFTIILRDVEDRQRAERELRKLKVENVFLREEMEAQSDF